ncbi:hypothetical protein SDC9_191870 [bioreactor metagenome]|uniref:Uncharacterized protein n=1 Tax=bioreactor metagenome TaxID=1076179 RepID=A0A645HZ74_9ZZZZ
MAALYIAVFTEKRVVLFEISSVDTLQPQIEQVALVFSSTMLYLQNSDIKLFKNFKDN